jgi:hypothetical protein
MRRVMTLSSSVFAALAFAATTSACGSAAQTDNPARIRDTAGATFALICEGGVCQLDPEPGTPPPATCGDARVWYSYFLGRFVNICSASGFADHEGWATNGPLCRLAACESDDECPELLGREYVCRSGLCQRDEELTNLDVVSLCFDAAPRPSDCHAQVQAPAVEAVLDLVNQACPPLGGACTVPASCRMP